VSVLIASKVREVSDDSVRYLVCLYCGKVHAEKHADEVVELNSTQVTDDAELARISPEINASALDLKTVTVRSQGIVARVRDRSQLQPQFLRYEPLGIVGDMVILRSDQAPCSQRVEDGSGAAHMWRSCWG